MTAFMNAAPAVFLDQSNPASGYYDIVHFQSRLSTGHFFLLTVSWANDMPSFSISRCALGSQQLLEIVHTCERYVSTNPAAGRAVAQARNIVLHFLCTMVEVSQAPADKTSVSTDAGPEAFTALNQSELEALMRKLGYKS